MNLRSSFSPAFLALPVAVMTTLALTPGALAQSTGSSGSLGSLAPSGSVGSLGGTSGPCHGFFGNIPPTSLGDTGSLSPTGSLLNSANSVLDTVGSSFRRFPRWISGTEGTIPVLTGATTVRQLVTGPTSPAETDELYNIHGTDLGIMVNHGDELMVIFGDTFGECTEAGNLWRSNVMLTATDAPASDGVMITGARPAAGNGHAAALVQGAHQPNGVGEVTVIPTTAISVGQALYMRVMSVRDWNAPGGWNTNYSALVRSTDDGATWTILTNSMRRVTDFTDWHPTVQFDPAHDPADLPPVDAAGWYGMQMSAFVADGDHLYEFVTPSGRRGPAGLARVPLDELEDPDAYEWYAGGGLWADEPTGHAVIPAPVEELSVQFNEHLGMFIAMTPTSTGVVSMRVAPAPEGPWSEPQTIVDRKMFPNGYAPMIHPESITSDGRYLYYTLSTWDAYNVFLLRTDLDAFTFTAPDSDTRTTVEARATVSTAAEAGAIDDDGVIDPQRLAVAANAAPAPAEPELRIPGR